MADQLNELNGCNAKQPNPVEVEMNGTGDELMRLRETAEMLIRRLTPTLTPEAPTAQAEEGLKEAMCSPLADSIRSYKLRIRDVSNMLQDAIDRLEL